MSTDHTLDPTRIIETDYVRCFEQMAAVEVEIRRRGASPHLLLRRAMLHMAIGDYVPALRAAQDAVARAPRHGEAHFQEGLAWLGMARVQCGAPVAPGVQVPVHRPLITLIENAYNAFCAAATSSPDDAEAVAISKDMEDLLMSGDAGIISALQDW